MHIIKVYLNTKNIVVKSIEALASNSQEYNTTISGLDHSTNYTIKISACKTDACAHGYPDVMKATTGGIPQKVNSVQIIQQNDVCSLTWYRPLTVRDKIIQYIIISEKLIYKTRNNSTNNYFNASFHLLNSTYTFNAQANHEYNLQVQAVTCGGVGEPVIAKGICVGAAKAPKNVSKPTVAQSMDGTYVTVNIPDETHGLMSCLFVIVSNITQTEKSDLSQNHYTVQQLMDVNNNPSHDEFIAIAISPLRFANKNAIVDLLGDNATSFCNISDTEINENIFLRENNSSNLINGSGFTNPYLDENLTSFCKTPNANSSRNSSLCDGNILATNKQLESDTRYSVYVVAVVPHKQNFSLQKSPSEIFATRSDGTIEFQYTSSPEYTNGVTRVSQEMNVNRDITWLYGIIVALVVLLLVAVVMLAYRKKFGKARSASIDSAKNTTAKEVLQRSSVSKVQISLDDGYSPYVNFSTAAKEKSTTLISMSKLGEVYRDKRHDNNAEFHQEFQKILIESSQFPVSMSIALDEALKPKNRYKNILPYNSTRVILCGTESGYINACYIKGFDKREKFIATQGPLRRTATDFWLMVYEQNTAVIVMLAKEHERGKKKCEKYWPDYGAHALFGSITVKNVNVISYNTFVCRTFTLALSGADQTSTVYQYQFLKWPDHGVPQTTSSLVRMHKSVMEMKENYPQSGPIIVHCSAGAGRTGTFIGYDLLLEESMAKNSVDGFNCVMEMRKQRVEMVQNNDQYVLLHKLILENYLFGETDCSPEELKAKFEEISSPAGEAMLMSEFSNLDAITPMNDSVINGMRKRNKTLGRHRNITPYDYSRVELVPQDDEVESPYINASWVESYDEETFIIAAEGPIDATVDVFWRAVFDNNVETIVMLTREVERKQKQCTRYWPSEPGEKLLFGKIVVTLIGDELQGPVARRTLRIESENRMTEVNQLQFTTWENESYPANEKEVIDLVLKLRQTPPASTGMTTLIHCSDGIGRTGAFCAILNMMDRLKRENRVDIFRAVKDLRDGRPSMVKTIDLYKFCYQAIVGYIKSFDLYENL